jgi:hypothetical protein
MLLPQHSRPLKYRLRVSPLFPELLEFKAHLTITAEILAPTSSIVLNAIGMLPVLPLGA